MMTHPLVRFALNRHTVSVDDGVPIVSWAHAFLIKRQVSGCRSMSQVLPNTNREEGETYIIVVGNLICWTRSTSSVAIWNFVARTALHTFAIGVIIVASWAAGGKTRFSLLKRRWFG